MDELEDDHITVWPPDHPNVAPLRPVTPEDPITDADVPF